MGWIAVNPQFPGILVFSKAVFETQLPWPRMQSCNCGFGPLETNWAEAFLWSGLVLLGADVVAPCAQDQGCARGWWEQLGAGGAGISWHSALGHFAAFAEQLFLREINTLGSLYSSPALTAIKELHVKLFTAYLTPLLCETSNTNPFVHCSHNTLILWASWPINPRLLLRVKLVWRYPLRLAFGNSIAKSSWAVPGLPGKGGTVGLQMGVSAVL